MQKTDIKYYVSQIIALPAVGIPTLVGIFLAGGYFGKFTGVHIGIFELFVIFWGVGGPTFKLTSVATGWLLERCGLLPRGAWRFYPVGTSWGSYVKKERDFLDGVKNAD
jgi:hypothetical protein